MSLTITDLPGAVMRARALAAAATPGERLLLGITGAPGAGKSTLAAGIVDALGPEISALVGMDGFHLSDAVLGQLGRWQRKGAPDTFDTEAYVDLLRRLRARRAAFAPVFDRSRELAEVGGMLVPPDVPLVVTEGNYLLLDVGHWGAVAGLLDESWYVDVDDTTRRERLLRRHGSHGWSPAEATHKTLGSDEENARLVAACRGRADVVVRLT